MRRFSSFLAGLAILSVLTLSACGGGTPKANVVATIAVPLSTISLNKGDVYQLSPTATDKNGAAVLATYTFASDNTALLNVSTNGSMWRKRPVSAALKSSWPRSSLLRAPIKARV